MNCTRVNICGSKGSDVISATALINVNRVEMDRVNMGRNISLNDVHASGTALSVIANITSNMGVDGVNSNNLDTAGAIHGNNTSMMHISASLLACG